ncbi:P-loop containing nucleoside triphosphate hydrolase protein [Chytriomyces sp. MP71]|nr:P-loop containing nucleoside triphosphate hydrolase protein [Chytriomyces sp. MP71]
MGPSGAGKSTFLDILAGKTKAGNVTGTVQFDGVVVTSDMQRNLIGFVDQEDVLMPALTVRETLLFSAQLRLPESIGYAEKLRRVEEVMATLGLSHVANTRVGGHGKRGISGGEKRRVSIGVELVTSPSVIVLDEPTSGLDSFNALSVIRTLSDLAKVHKKTVIFTIHQPRSDVYTLFDKVLVLSKGSLLYFGSGSGAATHFRRKGRPCPEGYNMADHLLDLASNEQLNTLGKIPSSTSLFNDDDMAVEELEKGVDGDRDKMLAPVEKPKHLRVGFFMQTKVLMGRASKNLIRTPSLLYAHVCFSVILGGLVGGLYYQSGTTLSGIQNRLGSILFILALLGFSGLSAIGSFAIEKILFLRERSNGFYGPMSYFFTKVLFDIIPLRIIPSIIMGSIAFFMIGFTNNGIDSFPKYLAILIFFGAEIGLLCLLFAISVHDIGTATLMLFAGLLINQDAIPPPLSWIQYLSFFRYAFEAIIVNDLTNVTIHDTVQGVTVTIPVSVVLQKFGFNIDAYWTDFLVSGGLVLILLFMNALMVQFRLKETR